MKNINAKVIIEYLEFYKGFSFHLDKNLLLEFDKLDGKFSFLHITGTCKEVSPEKYIRSLLDKFLDLLNFQEDIAIKNFFIYAEENDTDKSSPNKVFAERGICLTGKAPVQESLINSIEEKQLQMYSKDQLLCLDSYRRACYTEEPYAQYWDLYTIASILLGERECIDCYFLKNLSSSTTFSDYNKKEISSFVFARDLFSHHKKTSRGKEVDKDSFLQDNIKDFLSEVKQLMKNEIPNL